MPFLTSPGPAAPVTVYGSYPSGTAPGQYFIVLERDGQPTVIGQFTVVQNATGGTFSVTVSLPAGTYNLGALGAANGVAVYNAVFEPDKGNWSLAGPNTAITGRLGGSIGSGPAASIGVGGR
jgi:hypothetical protein